MIGSKYMKGELFEQIDGWMQWKKKEDGGDGGIERGRSGRVQVEAGCSRPGDNDETVIQAGVFRPAPHKIG